MTKRALLIIAFLEGGLVMLLELVIPHVLVPVLGNSVEMWAKLILLSVGGLAIGYFVGARLSRQISWNKLFSLLSIAFVFELVCYFIILGSNNKQLFGDEVLTAYIIAIFGLFIPTVALASTTPLIISEISKDANNTGLVFSYSTLGGILFTLMTGFMFIPEFGLVKTIQIFLLLISIMIVITTWKNKNRLIMYFSYSGFLISILIVFLGNSPIETKDIQVLEMKEGLNGQLMVVEKKVNDTISERTLFINRMGQTWLRILNGQNVASVWSYPGIVKSLASYHGKEPSNALVLGLGGGIVPLFLGDKTQLNYSIDAVELDKDIASFARDYFFLNYDVNVIEDDARRFLNANEKKYDLIVMDIFNGEIAPSHVLSIEAFNQVKKSLSKKGFVVINFNGQISSEAGISARSLLKTLLISGFKVEILPTFEKGERNRNNLFIASLQPLDFNKIKIPITYFDEKKNLKEYGIQKNLIDQKRLNLSTARVISDNFPMMEQLNQQAARQWREDYLKNITLKYRDQGVPLIK
ncbi:MAG: fused MFS/spermidine synthase [Crocinitomicaceae bacterium]|nr:fused MFS/spermidine synthase [Crocinitomicaceae bacterium]MCF8411037.1 fused MFS/spermidine synthase [Crocinitomicaceae bacterium]MCF8444492.1 fused MFS/spermidine synthase [Crocinitomicaceae bacterium]